MGRKALDLTGKRFGKLTIIGIDHVHPHNGVYWRCKCDCGNECVVIGSHLRNGHTKSCGCIPKVNLRNISKLHHEKYYDLGTKFDNSLRKSDLKPHNNNVSFYTGISYNKSRDFWRSYCDFQSCRYEKWFKNKEDAIQFRKLMRERRDDFIKWYDTFSSEEKENLTDDDKMYFENLFKSKMDELFEQWR